MKLRFQQSSSFKLASFFTVLIALSIAVVLYLLWLTRSLNGPNDIQALQSVMYYLCAGIILMLCVISGVGYFVGRFVVDLINTISDTASNIMHTGDLSRRIPLNTQWDDLSKLGAVLNEMFERIEQLVSGIRQVSDNVAHDLRTPLTRLRNQLEQWPDSAQSEKLLKEADQLLTMFNALLRIANIEAGKNPPELTPVPLHSVVRDVAELYEPMAEEKQQHFSVRLAECQITGDRDLLFQALANLLDNAIKFTPTGGRIELTLEPINDRALLTLTDSGPGIPAEEREFVFRRFYRSESSRTTPGHGLGLSMVAAVMKHHKGEMVLSDNHPGLVIRAIFRLA